MPPVFLNAWCCCRFSSNPFLKTMVMSPFGLVLAQLFDATTMSISSVLKNVCKATWIANAEHVPACSSMFLRVPPKRIRSAYVCICIYIYSSPHKDRKVNHHYFRMSPFFFTSAATFRRVARFWHVGLCDLPWWDQAVARRFGFS